MSQKELDLFQLSSSSMTETSAGAAQVVRSQEVIEAATVRIPVR